MNRIAISDRQSNSSVPSTIGLAAPSEEFRPQPACPICGGPLVEIRAKLQCGRCHAILETCCEGGKQ